MDIQNKQNPLFSIITVCYNSERTIERTIKSILAQSFDNYEYIIIDGKSKDNTMSIVQKYAHNFNGKMRWISEPDKGIYDAMNKGISLSNGALIGIVNSDDWLEPNALQQVHATYLQNNESLSTIYCGHLLFHKNEGTVSELKADLSVFRASVKKYSMFGIRHPSAFVPKKVYSQVGLYDVNIRLSADQDFIIRAHSLGIHFCIVDAFLSNMSDGGFSNDSTSYSVALKDRKYILKKYTKSVFEYFYCISVWIIRQNIKKLFKKMRLYKVK